MKNTDVPSSSTSNPPAAGETHQAPGLFPATQWSVIRQVQAEDESVQRLGWERMCRNYWRPVYAWLRARGSSAVDAEDLTQEFFSRLIAGADLAEVCAEKGRLRSFLLVVLKRQAANAWEYRQAQKRGGGKIMVPLDAKGAEETWKSMPTDGASPDVIFDRQWALQILEQVMSALRETYVKAGKGELFEELREYISGASQEESYAASAERLGMSEGAIKVAAFRLRQRYRERLRVTVTDTVSSAEEVNDEINWLFRVFR